MGINSDKYKIQAIFAAQMSQLLRTFCVKIIT